MRTPDEIACTDALADRCRYQAPPADLEPTGPMHEQRSNWQALCDWFAAETDDWHDSLLVYISRRWDTPFADVYAQTDSWVKAELNRREREADPEAVLSFN